MCSGAPSHSGGSSLRQVSTLPMDQHPTGYIVSNAEDLLSLFNADYGVRVIGMAVTFSRSLVRDERENC